MLHRKRPKEDSKPSPATVESKVSRKTESARSNAEKRPQAPRSESQRSQSTPLPRGNPVSLQENVSRIPTSKTPGSSRANTSKSSVKTDAQTHSRSIPGFVSSSKTSLEHRHKSRDDVPLVTNTDAVPKVKQNSHGVYSPFNLGLSPSQGIMQSDRGRSSRSSVLPPRLIPELQALALQPVNEVNPSYKSVISVSPPSTLFSDSPGPWSASTATTTPTSWSSASPALVQSTGPGTPGKRSKTIPAPSPARTGLPKLPIVDESYQGKVSNTSAPMTPPKEQVSRKKKSKSLLDSDAPTPPPRASSASRGRSRSSSVSGKDKTPEKRPPIPSSSLEPDISPLAGRSQADIGRIGDSIRQKDLGHAHNSLQSSLTRPSTRSRREDSEESRESRRVIRNAPKTGSDNKSRELLASAVEEKQKNRTRHAPSELPATVPRSPSRLGKFSRFALFGRQAKSTPELDKSPKKLQRRGPAAGTGHEGYGKYAKRGRKQSIDTTQTNSDGERSISSSRRKPMFGSGRKDSSSQSDLDEFVATRMRPVIMRGGSRNSERAGQRNSNFSQNDLPNISRERFAGNSPQGSQYDLEQESIAGSADFTASPEGYQLEAAASMPRLALRRSQRFGSDTDSFRMPAPIKTNDLSVRDYNSSLDTTQPSIIETSAPPSASIRETAWPTDPPSKHHDKKTRKLKWNLFRRKTIDTGTPQKNTRSPPPPMPGMAVAYATGPMPRSVPYYAMMESESENNVTERIGQLLSEVVESPQHSPSLGHTHPTYTDDVWSNSRYVESASLPIPSSLSGQQQQHQVLDRAKIFGEQSDQPNLREKRSRLPQVGRIPKVVSQNERQHRPSRSSFSQPFVKKQPSDSALQNESISMDQEPVQPPLEIHTDILPSRPFMEGTEREIVSAPIHFYGGRSSYEPVGLIGQDFLKFKSKHESEISTSTSSGGVSSLFGPKVISTSGRGNDHYDLEPSATVAEDEVWNEYDDILDHVMSPPPPKTIRKQPRRILALPAISTPPVIGIPTTIAEGLRAFAPRPLQTIEQRRLMEEPLYGASLAPPTIIPSSPSNTEKSNGEDTRLRRSRIVSALHSSIDPTSPFSMGDFLNEYSEGFRDSGRLSERLSTSSAGVSGPLPTPSAPPPPPERYSTSEHTHGENAALLDVVQRNKDPATTSELHFASLEVSRWLSFGRVLFSPAHDEIHVLPKRNVLVIDGLGNEDWSIYCAVTYEAEKAIVYDLKEVTHSRSSQTLRHSQHSPHNHRRVEINSFADRFPFQSAFFSAIVLRFPPAMADSKMKNIITECRRILVPGGHLELMLLDIDIVNMGVHTRKAVRELKMRMNTADRDISLKPIIDNIQGILGGRGFSSLNRCVVGVPVAGRPTGSIDSSCSSRSSGASERSQRASFDSKQLLDRARSRKGSQRHDPKFSLNDLVADRSENADAKIGRMVSRTARSWWQHCFEATVLPNGDLTQSVFANKTVLGECKARASSFKLLIAYAQRPVFEARRRTMSEPTVSTLATVGVQHERKASARK